MKKYIFVLMLFACAFKSVDSAGQNRKEIGNLVIENIPDIPDELRDRLNQYQNTRGAKPIGWSPNGNAMLMSTRFGETSQVHLISMPGGARKQITFFKEQVTRGNFCPNPAHNGFMFLKDIDGNEFNQLYWFDLSNGKYEMISDGGINLNSNVLWSEDGTMFIHTSTRRNMKDYDLYLGNMSDKKNARLILEREGFWEANDWSKDNKKVIISNYLSVNKSLVYILDLASGGLEQINPSVNEDVAYGQCAWTSDSKGIYYISDQEGEFMSLKYYDVVTKKSSVLTKDLKWDVEDFIINKQRNTIVFQVNENGTCKLYKMNLSTNEYHQIDGLPLGIIYPYEFHPDGNQFCLIINSPKSPNDIYSYDLASNKLTQWTYSEIGGLDNSQFVLPTLIEYETFDKVDGKTRKIPAFYYKPRTSKGKIPVVIDIHGGPEAQSIPYFDPFRSYLINELGIAVIEPNVRGSKGYGKSYLKLDNGYKREESVKDIGKLLDWINLQPELDASRVAVTGGSYGGYMVLASLTHFSDRIRCGVDVVGISNFVTFLNNTEDYRKDLRRVEYGDERDPKMKEFLSNISPANHVDKITRPLLIIQGKNDPRVPVTESEQMKNKMQEKGKVVWYLMAKDEGHGFRKKENWTFEQLSTILFLQKYLLN